MFILYSNLFIFTSHKILGLYCFTIYGVVFASPLSGRFPFFHPIPVFYAEIPCYSFSTCYTAHGARVGGGVTMGGVEAFMASYLVRVFTQAFDLTRQPDSRFRIPVRLPFPQGTG